MDVDALLEQLADGSWLAMEALSLSPGALSQRLDAIRALGVNVEESPAQGYRIPGGVELLDRDVIAAALSDEASSLLANLQVLRCVDSTNAELMRHAPAPPRLAQVCVADCQTAGRGRRGRHWVSPLGCNLYLSIDWHLDDSVDRLQGLPLAVGVAVADASAALGVPGISLKWPNDLLHGGAKLGGILVESLALPDGSCRSVLGIGVNVRMPESAAAQVDQRWTDMHSLSGGSPPRRDALAGALLVRLLPLLRDFPDLGFAPWRERWMARDAYADSPVVVTSGDRRLAGIARGVDDQGALRLETDEGLQLLHGGELSLRSAA